MRARALARPRLPLHASAQARSVAALAPAALVFLRGRDADARLRELAAARAAARPLLGALAERLVERHAHEALGYRSLGDYGRERLGLGARCLREWARVWRRLGELPVLREAVLSGDVGWEVARRVVGVVTPETQRVCLDAVRGRTVRAVEAIVEAVREAQARAAAGPEPENDPAAAEGARVPVRLACTRREAELWFSACELARRVAGEDLPVWECAERIAAEAASALGAEAASALGAEAASALGAEAASALGAEAASALAPEAAADFDGPAPGSSRQQTSGREVPARAPEPDEHGLRERAFPGLAWQRVPRSLPARLAALAEGLGEAPPRELDGRLRAVVELLQTLDLEVGRILRQMQDRGLFAELGFPGLARYAAERLDLSARTARRLVALARTEHRAPAVAVAFRAGRIHAFQARALSRVAHVGNARAWVERARRGTLRRLEAEVDAALASPTGRAAIAFRAPPEVAAFFQSMLARAGSLERLLAHAIVTWVELGAAFDDYADFTRDGFRCTAPGCTARRSLQSHHIRFRSAGGPDEAWNRTTLCAFHHQRGVHGTGALRIRGRAPGGLVYALGPEPCERFRSEDVRMT